MKMHLEGIVGPRARATLFGTLLGLAAFAGAAPVQAQQTPAQLDRGFVLRVNVGGEFTLIGGGLGASVGAVQAGFFAGAKLGRFMVGGGIGFTNVTQTTSVGMTTTTNSQSSVRFVPEFTAAVLRSADERVELIVDAALGVGAAIPSGGGASTFLLSYQVGPGVRFWAHPNFAVQALTGFSGSASFPPNMTVSAHGIFASVGLLGVF